MPTFTCSICGQVHEGLTTDWACTLPDDVWAIPEAQRLEAATFTEDLCQFGERYFIRCVLPVRLREAADEFNWGAWAEVEWPTFERYLALYDQDGSAEPQHKGTLANALEPYSESFGATVLIQFRDPTKRPTLWLTNGDQSELAREQRTGIDNARYHEILDVLHGPAP
jgi:hypothetical protein